MGERYLHWSVGARDISHAECKAVVAEISNEFSLLNPLPDS